MFASLLWGTEGTATIYAPAANVASLGLIGLLAGAILQVSLSFRSLRKHAKKLHKQLLWIIIGGFVFASFPLAFLNSVRLSGIAVGTVITMGSSPIFSALIERLIDKQGLTKQWLMGFPLGLLGIILLSFYGVPHHARLPQSQDMALIGSLLGLIAGFCFSLNSWSMHRLIEHHIPSPAAASSIFISATLWGTPLIALSFKSVVTNPQSLSVALYIGVVIYFIAYMSFSFGLSRIKTSTATVITLLEPVTATLLACLVAHEKLSLSGWIGISFIMLCMGAMSLPTKKKSTT